MDNAKIDEIYRKNAAIIYKYLCGLTQNPQMAEDLTQETFFRQSGNHMVAHSGKCDRFFRCFDVCPADMQSK